MEATIHKVYRFSDEDGQICYRPSKKEAEEEATGEVSEVFELTVGKIEDNGYRVIADCYHETDAVLVRDALALITPEAAI